MPKILATLPDPTALHFKPGVYRHYSGDLYRALMLVNHHETRELMVVYISLKKGSANVREYATFGKDSWTDIVDVGASDGVGEVKPVARFTFIEPAY